VIVAESEFLSGALVTFWYLLVLIFAWGARSPNNQTFPCIQTVRLAMDVVLSWLWCL